MRRSLRLQDVATKAGVSFITAWRALNKPEMVASKAAAKVRSTAAEIGYVRNAAARSLVTATSGVVGVIVPTLADSIFSETVHGISGVLTENGIEILIGISNYDQEREASLIRAFIGYQIDGLIMTGGSHVDATRRLLENAGVAVVEIWDLPADPIDMAVGFSNTAIAEAATEFLISHGYKRIAFASPLNRSRGVDPELGYRQAMEKAGACQAIRSLHVEPTLDGGANAFKALMADDPPDAIFFNGDTLAIGALFQAQQEELRCPEDICLLGIHDIALALHVSPGLSTVRLPRYEIGAKAAEALKNRFSDPHYTVQCDVGFEIISRGSARSV